MPATRSSTPGTALRLLDQLCGSSPLPDVRFRLWDGTFWPDETTRPATLVLKHPGALRAMFSSGTEIALAESYLADDFDVEGDIEAACGLADHFEHRATGWRDTLSLHLLLRRLPGKPGSSRGWRTFAGHDRQRHSRERVRDAISFHYDVSNDFYRLWLDRNLLYSCAYFTDQDNDIETAQLAKLRHLCRKLRLRPGQRLLDIGCGWGGLALHAAREHGVEVTGVTLSTRQAELADARIQEAGLGGKVRIELKDYRELHEAESYDAIVSVGMSEHVGEGQLPEYFRTASRLLKPGGVFLNHAIGGGVRPRHRRGGSFIQRHVFPDSHVPPIPAVVQAAESAGLEVRDVENLREHYALTLRHWVRRLEARHEEALAHIDEPTYRVWRLYMAGSAHGFDRGRLAIYQVLLSKLDTSGNAALPLTRADWYG